MTPSHVLYTLTLPPPISVGPSVSVVVLNDLSPMLPLALRGSQQSQPGWPVLGLKQEVANNIKNLTSFLAELEALVVWGMCLARSHSGGSCTVAVLLGALGSLIPQTQPLSSSWIPLLFVSPPGSVHTGDLRY